MTIPESQLEIWSKQGSNTQSKATCDTVRSVLNAKDSPYAAKNFDTFLQGSYANDTNIYADSDVDIVIRLDSTYFYNLSGLDEADKAAFNRDFSSATYSYEQFKADVTAHLAKHFGSAVKLGTKAIFIQGSGGRRDADVLPAAVYYHYTHYRSAFDRNRVEGICFWANGVQIINYPKQHSANCTAKHQATAQWFKPTVRIFKNMRNRMVEKGLLPDGLAPSYFVEGMLYNVPNTRFGTSYQSTVAAALSWLLECKSDQLLCANEQYFLLNASSPVTWREEKFERFLTEAVKFWNNWPSN